jgi:hypothetical protein
LEGQNGSVGHPRDKVQNGQTTASWQFVLCNAQHEAIPAMDNLLPANLPKNLHWNTVYCEIWKGHDPNIRFRPETLKPMANHSIFAFSSCDMKCVILVAMQIDRKVQTQPACISNAKKQTHNTVANNCFVNRCNCKTLPAIPLRPIYHGCCRPKGEPATSHLQIK